MSYANYQDVIDQLRGFGLGVTDLVIGKVTPCQTTEDKGREKKGWYVVHELQTQSGDIILVGAYGNWREGLDASGRPISHRIELRKAELTADERAVITRRIAENKRIAAGLREKQARIAAAAADKIWRRLPVDGQCGYLTRKGIKAHGARFTPKGNLVIPLQDAMARVHGLQIIYGDPKEKQRRGRDKDFWPAGLAKRGHFYLIGIPGWLILIAEGFATGASLHEATGLPVVVAYDAGNLAPVSEAIRKRYRDAKLLICGDDDFLTPGNPGKSAASLAAVAVNGGFVLPEFTDRGERKLTDFNDLAKTQGLAAVREQVERWLLGTGWKDPRATNATGGTGERHAFDFSLDALLKRYSLIYSTETLFDAQTRQIISISALRAAAGKTAVREWSDHPERQIVMPEQVVFDPIGINDPDKVCNLWEGWPTQPKSGCCDLMLDLLRSLCLGDRNAAGLTDWIIKWLAYPIQNPGSKMQTSLLVHGPEGTGKNLFFSAIREIYGKYGGVFDQTQLESQYNDWASGKLMMLGNEVVARAELYHQQGRLKTMITEREWQINAKFLPARMEANHCNFVFFSNRIDIAKLDRDDRRYCVVWTPKPLSEGFYSDVADEKDHGGVEALHDYLLSVDLTGFSTHTKPPMTDAKHDLVNLSMDSTEKFYQEWTSGELGVPIMPVRSEDIFALYKSWANARGIPKYARLDTLVMQIKKKDGMIYDRGKYYKGSSIKQARFIFPPGCSQPPDMTQVNWLTQCIDEFVMRADEWRAECSGGYSDEH